MVGNDRANSFPAVDGMVALGFPSTSQAANLTEVQHRKSVLTSYG